MLKLAGTGLDVQGLQNLDIPEAPPLLDEIEQVEKWGLPNTGTWLDQPVEYMEDVEAAMEVKAYLVTQAKNKQELSPDQVFANAPAPRSVVD